MDNLAKKLQQDLKFIQHLIVEERVFSIKFLSKLLGIFLVILVLTVAVELYFGL